MISEESLDALGGLTLEFRQLIQSLDTELAGFSGEKEAEVSAARAERLDSLATAVHETVARFAAVVEIEEQSQADNGADDAGSALRMTEAYQEAYGQLEFLAAAFGNLQSATAASQRASEAEAGAARRRYNAAQRYLDASRH